ncbi:transketolase-like TK C-terminal-containing protein [Actinacidiphila rubida]|uniref:Pyruvate dehydrogenase E1 component n=1 Tax=Actinacidiphila rubida TaxID=310780 RepID=A0A1H8K8N3_9ACTN|nr:hypothetical protein [Actinacidiphila rubida]SEN89061.1 pyruvate dehydrogenase E1 component [Actinacidiphila rubida]
MSDPSPPVTSSAPAFVGRTAVVLGGMYRLRTAESPLHGPRIQLLASGAAVHDVLGAQRVLGSDWGVHADVWSVASWTDLHRDALDADRARRRGEDRIPCVTARLSGTQGPVLAVSEGKRQVLDRLGPWVEQDYATLGSDGTAWPGTCEGLPGEVRVDVGTIVVTALHRLRRLGAVDPETVVNSRVRYGWRA